MKLFKIPIQALEYDFSIYKKKGLLNFCFVNRRETSVQDQYFFCKYIYANKLFVLAKKLNIYILYDVLRKQIDKFSKILKRNEKKNGILYNILRDENRTDRCR